MALTETLIANKLQVALTSVAVVAVGGAVTYFALTGGLFGGDDMLDAVPSEADMVMHVDGDVTEDERTRELVNEFIEAENETNESYDGPGDYEEAVAEAENDSDLSLDGFNGMTVFGKYDPGDDAESSETENDSQDYTAAIIDSDWGEDEFVESTANGSEYEERTYEGYTLYRVNESDDEDEDSDAEIETGVESESGFETETESEYEGWNDDDEYETWSEEEEEDDGPTWIAVLAEGRYVTGSEAAVKDAVDVDRGAAESIGDDLRSAYESTRDGHFRFAMMAPEDAGEGNYTEDARTAAALTGVSLPDNVKRLQKLADVDSFAGAYYTTDEAVGIEYRIAAHDEDTADDLRSLIDGTVTMSEYGVPPNETAALFDDTTVEREGADVVVTFESTPADIGDAFEALANASANATGILGPDNGTDYGPGYDDGFGDDEWDSGSEYDPNDEYTPGGEYDPDDDYATPERRYALDPAAGPAPRSAPTA